MELLTMSNEEEPYENITRVFWIKLELREASPAGRQSIGEIRDVRSGARRLLYCRRDISDFMAPYMQQMGFRTGRWCWLPVWMRKGKNRMPPHKGWDTERRK